MLGLHRKQSRRRIIHMTSHPLMVEAVVPIVWKTRVERIIHFASAAVCLNDVIKIFRRT